MGKDVYFIGQAYFNFVVIFNMFNFLFVNKID